MAPLRTIRARLRASDPHIRDVAIYADLVDHLHTNVAAVAGGVVGGVALAWVSHLCHPDGRFLVMLVLMALVGALRLIGIAYYKQRVLGRLTRIEEIRRWEILYGAGGWLFAALLGAFCILVLMDDHTQSLHTITTAATVGYAGGIAGRNAGRPLVAIGQVLLACVPLAVMLLWEGKPTSIGLAVLLIIYSVTLLKIVGALNNIVAKAFIKERVVGQMNAKLDAAITHMMNGLCMVDAEGHIQVLNERFQTMLDLGEAPLDRLHEILLRCVAVGTMNHRDVRLIQDALASQVDLEHELSTASGKVLVVKASATPGGGQIITLDDVTERTRAAADIARMARTDALTGLANRAAIIAAVNASGARPRTGGPLPDDLAKPQTRARPAHVAGLALLLIDLDRFKEVNDTLGHDAGDQLLVKVGERLAGLVRPPDVFGRLGGDEFVILHFDASQRDAELLASRIVKALAKPFRIGRHTVHSGASIGIALAPLHADDAAGLMKCADIALYARKAKGRNGFEVFDAEMAERLSKQRQMEIDLSLAVKAGEIAQAYQPIVDAVTHEVIAVEVLARWTHPRHGQVPPDVFIRLAESTGLIGELGRRMLLAACSEAARWPENVRVSVNVSALQFKERSALFNAIEQALKRSGLAAPRLDLEVTESVLIEDAEGMLTFINALKARGISVSLDDFGTGYSSLAYVQNYNFDRIKLDRAFARSIEEDRTTRATIAALANIAQATGSRLLLEGVETEGQARIAAAHGVNELQGYLFGRPQGVEEIRMLLGVEGCGERAA